MSVSFLSTYKRYMELVFSDSFNTVCSVQWPHVYNISGSYLLLKNIALTLNGVSCCWLDFCWAKAKVESNWYTIIQFFSVVKFFGKNFCWEQILVLIFVQIIIHSKILKVDNYIREIIFVLFPHTKTFYNGTSTLPWLKWHLICDKKYILRYAKNPCQ